jgi:hypothetical protein
MPEIDADVPNLIRETLRALVETHGDSMQLAITLTQRAKTRARGRFFRVTADMTWRYGPEG